MDGKCNKFGINNFTSNLQSDQAKNRKKNATDGPKELVEELSPEELMKKRRSKRRMFILCG